MEKVEQAKQIIDSMNEEEQIILLSKLIESIWGKDRNGSDTSESIFNLVNNNKSNHKNNVSSFDFEEFDAEIINLQEYKRKKQAGL